MRLINFLRGQRSFSEDKLAYEVIGGDLEHPTNVAISEIGYKPYLEARKLVLLNPNHGSKVYQVLDVSGERVLVQDTGFKVRYNDILLKHREEIAKGKIPKYKREYILDPRGSKIDLARRLR